MGYAIAKQLGIEYVRNRTVGENDAVMFDIDETLFQSNGEPIQDVIDLFHECDRLGYRIIIITARPDYAANHHYTQVSHLKQVYTLLHILLSQKDSIKEIVEWNGSISNIRTTLSKGKCIKHMHTLSKG